MSTIDLIKERYEQTQSANGSSVLTPIEQKAFNTFATLGIPTVKNEEWKYIRIGGVLAKEYAFNPESITGTINHADIDAVRLPGHEEANELVFVNGLYAPSLSTIRSAALTILTLEEATKGDYRDTVLQHLGHSSKYMTDGLNALNTAFAAEGIFIDVKKGKVVEHPVYIYNIADARSANVLSQPRTLIYVGENAQVIFWKPLHAWLAGEFHQSGNGNSGGTKCGCRIL